VTLGALIAALERRGVVAASPRLDEALAARRATAVVYDSSRASAGSVFVGIRGQRADGAAYAPQAVARGAAVVVAESPAVAGVDVPTPASRSPRSPPSSTTIPRGCCASSASRAPTARPRART
jgi:UDP-N-acetylmuramyl pentapeptide synthase